MKQRQFFMRVLSVALFAVPISLWSAEQENVSADKFVSGKAQELRQQITEVIESRNAAISDVNERYRGANPEARVALEAEGAQIQVDYERAYLSLLVEYHRLTGNQLEMEKAERNLARTNGEPIKIEPQDADMQRALELKPGTEGVVTNEQN
jgi:phage replication-related protein YjqB (UPF0714/DUF867 family)